MENCIACMESCVVVWDNLYRKWLSLYGIPIFLQFQPHERIFYDILAPGTIGEMGLHHTKLEEMARSAVILRIFTAKRYVAAGTYSLSHHQ